MTRKPFTLETVIPYLGRNLRLITPKIGVYSSKKRNPKSGVMLFAAGVDSVIIKNRISRSLTAVTYPALLNQYVLDNGSSCGTITCRDGDGFPVAEKLPSEASPPVQPVCLPPVNIVDRFLLLKEEFVSIPPEELVNLDTHDVLRYVQTIEKYLKTMLNLS